MKRILSQILAVLLILPLFSLYLPFSVSAETASLAGEAKSVILMEAETGRVLYEYEADLRLPPASVTDLFCHKSAFGNTSGRNTLSYYNRFCACAQENFSLLC